MRRSEKSGFTLVELLVVIAIIGVLVALLLPAVMAAQRMAQRLKCMSKIKQVATALHTHATQHNTFPPGMPTCTDPPAQSKKPPDKHVPWITGGTQVGNFCQGPSALSAILPQLEEHKRYDALVRCMKSKDDGRNATDDCDHFPVFPDNPDDQEGFGQVTPKAYICPSADKMSADQRLGAVDEVYGLDGSLAKGNYVLNWGPGTFTAYTNERKAGAFDVRDIRGIREVAQVDARHASLQGSWKMGLGKGVRVIDFKDGTANTLLVSEIIGFDSYMDARGVWTSPAMGASIFTARNGPNPVMPASGDDGGDDRSIWYDKIPMCDEERTADTDFECLQNQENGQVWASVRSRHGKGVNVALADGSGKFISDTIDVYNVWQPMSTRAGKEPFDMPP